MKKWKLKAHVHAASSSSTRVFFDCRRQLQWPLRSVRYSSCWFCQIKAEVCLCVMILFPCGIHTHAYTTTTKATNQNKTKQHFLKKVETLPQPRDVQQFVWIVSRCRASCPRFFFFCILYLFCFLPFRS
jgi:hypothetical protein